VLFLWFFAQVRRFLYLHAAQSGETEWCGKFIQPALLLKPFTGGFEMPREKLRVGEVVGKLALGLNPDETPRWG